jgi:hypothetical protein
VSARPSERAWILVVAVTSIATVAIGLRVGAPDAMRAAIVVGAPPPRSGGKLAWQVRTQDDDLHTRTAASLPIHVVVRARVASGNTERAFDVTTNVDGVAEITADVPDVRWGERVELEVRDGQGVVLARGVAAWPPAQPKPTILERTVVRASRSEGALHMTVAVLGGSLAPGQPGRVWITTQATGEPPRDLRIEANPDVGIDVAHAYTASRDPTCTRGGVIELVARGHNGGVAFHAKDALAREGDWYGGIPIAAGGMIVGAPLSSPPGPVRFSITSASARSLAYVEVDDDVGRVAASMLPLTGEPPHGDVTFDLETPGRHFLVVSGEPDGATTIAGATRALPLWIGPNAPCESDLAEMQAVAFPRFVALDGFVEKRAALNAKRKRGRAIALGSLALGSLLETLLLLRAAAEGRRRMQQLHEAIAEGGDPSAPVPAARRGPLDVAVIVMLSLLGFVLLFALIEWTSR